MANKAKIKENLKKFGRFMLIVLNMSLNVLLLKGIDSKHYDYYQAIQAEDEQVKRPMVRDHCSTPVGVACA